MSSIKNFLNRLEEFFIVITLACMTLITVANVIARYVFNSTILWALEGTLYLFAWLVIIGVSYGVKHHLHLGIDSIIKVYSPAVRKVLAYVAVLTCLTYSLSLLIGSWNYWFPFIREQAFLETEDIPIPDFLQFLSVWLNEGEAYEKLPRFIPYFALPLGLFLLSVRFLIAGIHIYQNKIDRLIASH